MPPIPPWSDLPQELLSTISNLLTSNPNALAFRSVCKSWRSSSPSISSPPILSPLLPLITPMPRPPLDVIGPPNTTCVLYVTVVISFRPHLEDPLLVPNTWVCSVDQFSKYKLRIHETFCKEYYSRPVKFPKSLNLLDFHASELGRFYNLVGTKWGCKIAKKVVLLSDISVALILSKEGRVGFIWLETNKQWEIIHDGTGYRIDDIVEVNGMILGVDRRGRIYEIRLESDRSFTIHLIVRTPTGGGGKRKRLVESLGELYLVVKRKVDQTDVALMVFHLLLDANKRWEQVTGIGDRIFIFDIDFSLSVSTQQLGGIYTKNCIVYDICSFGRGYHGYDIDDYLNSSIRLKRDIRVCHFEDAAHIRRIRSCPGYSKMFWPTPSWLKKSVRDP